MPSFSQSSKNKLATCSEPLQRLFNEVVKHYDCVVIEGYRGQEAQHKAFVEGRSKLDWPKGKHNQTPSMAVDVMPFPLNWKDEKQLHHFIGFVQATAIQMGINITSGHDWDDDFNLEEHSFQDGPHWELK
jgi:peptidoglycan L-alanyl-D-glutamate endopeptidase CwlK